MKRGYLVFSLVLTLAVFLSSCFTIEKRIYRDGYYVKKNTTVPAKHREYAAGTDLIPASPTFAQEVNRVTDIEFIPYEKPVIFSGNYLPAGKNPEQDTLPPKKDVKKNRGPQKFDEGKDVTKKEKSIPGSVIIGLFLGVVSFSFLFWILLIDLLLGAIALGLTISIFGFIFSWMGLKRINSKENMDGRGLAVAGMILNGLFLAAAVVGFIWVVAMVFSALAGGI